MDESISIMILDLDKMELLTCARSRENFFELIPKTIVRKMIMKFFKLAQYWIISHTSHNFLYKWYIALMIWRFISLGYTMCVRWFRWYIALMKLLCFENFENYDFEVKWVLRVWEHEYSWYTASPCIFMLLYHILCWGR